MTANVTYGTSFSGLESYLSNKVEQGKNQSELIYFENVSPDVKLTKDGEKFKFEVKPNAISKEMKSHVQSQKTKVQKPVMHTSFNFHKNENLSNSQMVDASLSALKEVGITPDNHQITMYRHQDKEHPHVHCMVNRVGLNGKVHDNSFIANRLMVACDKIEKEQNLRPTKGRIFVFDEKAKNGYRKQTKAERERTTKPKLTKKQRIQAVHEKIKTEFNRELKTAKSFEEIKANLSKKGIETNIATNKNGVYGLSFKSDDIAVKASKIGIKVNGVKQTLSKNIKQNNEILKEKIYKSYKGIDRNYKSYVVAYNELMKRYIQNLEINKEHLVNQLFQKNILQKEFIKDLEKVDLIYSKAEKVYKNECAKRIEEHNKLMQQKPEPINFFTRNKDEVKRRNEDLYQRQIESRYNIQEVNGVNKHDFMWEVKRPILKDLDRLKEDRLNHLKKLKIQAEKKLINKYREQGFDLKKYIAEKEKPIKTIEKRKVQEREQDRPRSRGRGR